MAIGEANDTPTQRKEIIKGIEMWWHVENTSFPLEVYIMVR